MPRYIDLTVLAHPDMPCRKNNQRGIEIENELPEITMHDENPLASALRKINRRYIPLLFACFVIAWLDRVNVGFAALTMSRDLGLSSTAFGIGAGIFFVTYVILEVPANVMLERVGARRWFALLMLGWGLASGAMIFVQGEKSLYLARLILGAAEAGFAPGVFYYLSLWVPAEARGRMIAGFLVAMPVASVIGAPLSGLLMQLDGLGGLHGWQWMFLIETLPALALTPFVLRILCDRPEQATWLTDAERDALSRSLVTDTAGVSSGHVGVLSTMRNPLVLALGVVYFGVVGLNYELSFFLPQIVHQFGLSIVQTGFVAAIPFFVAGIGMTWWGRRSDRLGERRFHLVMPLVLAVAGLAGSTVTDLPVLRLVLLCVAAFGVFSALPIFWTLPAALFPLSAVAAGIAVVNSVGSVSGFVDSYAIGAIKDATGSFAGGMQLVAGFGAIAICILVLITRNTAWAAKGNKQTKRATRSEVAPEIPTGR
ncbi:MFS transporter [Paraburkholderia elongata]|nr:MFS transporter [Paraburkholderia elongata]